jgi:hypothetical protein
MNSIVDLYSECFSKFMAQDIGLFSFYTVPIVLLITVHIAYSRLRGYDYHPLHAIYFVLIGQANYWALLAGSAMFDDCLSPRFKPTVGVILIAASLLGMTIIMQKLVVRTIKCSSEEAQNFLWHWAGYNIFLSLLSLFVHALVTPNY